MASGAATSTSQFPTSQADACPLCLSYAWASLAALETHSEMREGEMEREREREREIEQEVAREVYTETKRSVMRERGNGEKKADDKKGWRE